MGVLTTAPFFTVIIGGWNVPQGIEHHQTTTGAPKTTQMSLKKASG